MRTTFGKRLSQATLRAASSVPGLYKPTMMLSGVATYVPGLYRPEARGSGGTASARYCYSVWLRHLTLAFDHGLSSIPKVVAELGPGNSLGIGLAALLSGASVYYAFDVVRYVSNATNLEVFQGLVDLFGKRENIPDETEFPNVEPRLESYVFPNRVLTDEWLDQVLEPERIPRIRNAILVPGNEQEQDVRISYFAPWHDADVVREESVDMVLSQATMEHIDDLPGTYRALHRWLKPGGFMSHEIDFRCHGTAHEWNGHWGYSDLAWRVMRGRRAYLLNRQPHSAHVDLLSRSGFRTVCDIPRKTTSGIRREHLASRFKNVSDDDLTTSGAFMQAVKC